MNGALLVDKPPGCSSAQAVGQIKRRFKISSVGHCGTLDPLASGLLILLCGNSTRLQFLFLESNKVYEGTIRLGISTDTDDLEGQIIAEDPSLGFANARSLDQWKSVIEEHFTGSQLQIPPIYSAINVNGQRSYDLARRGKEVQLTPRPVSIHSIKVDFVSNNRMRYYVCCSSGTYVRSLARDIGKFLGSYGCAESIRRVGSGDFSVTQAHPLDFINSQNELSDHLIDNRQLVAKLPSLRLNEAECIQLKNGQQGPLLRAGSVRELDNVLLCAVYNSNDDVIALAERPDLDTDWRIRCILS